LTDDYEVKPENEHVLKHGKLTVSGCFCFPFSKCFRRICINNPHRAVLPIDLHWEDEMDGPNVI